MALVTCPECTGAVSSEARACPHCGWVPPRAARRPITGGLAVIVLVGYPLLVVALMYAMPNYAALVLGLAIVGAAVAWRQGVVQLRRDSADRQAQP